MKNGINKIYTENIKDFKKMPKLNAVNPVLQLGEDFQLVIDEGAQDFLPHLAVLGHADLAVLAERS